MKTLNEQISALQAKRAEVITKMEALLNGAESDDRALNEEEQGQFDALEAKSVDYDARIANLEKTEKRIITKAPTVLTNMMSKGKGREREKGCFFARMAHALYVNGGNRQQAAAYVRSMFDDRELESVLKAPQHVFQKAETAPAQTSVEEWAGALAVQNEMTGEFIDMLRPMSIMARTPARRMNFDGSNSIKIPRRASGISGSYIGENVAIPVNQANFGSLILAPKKIAVITVASTENLERSTPALEMLLRDDMLLSTAEVVDGQFIDGVGSATAPGGITTYGTPITPGAGTPVDNIAADMKALFDILDGANCPMMNPVLYMHTNEYNALLFAQDANSNYIYRDEVSGGTLFGATIIKSNSVTAGTVVLADANQVMIAEDQAPTLDISEDAAVHMDTAPADDLAGVVPGPGVGLVRSLWQNDLAGIRLRWRHDWTVRNAGCVAYGVSVVWS